MSSINTSEKDMQHIEGVAGAAAIVRDLAVDAERKDLKVTELDRDGLILVNDGPGKPPRIRDLAEEYGLQPTRHRGTVHVGTVQALVDYLTEHATDATTVWVHPTSGRVEAVIDDHTKGQPGNRDHRAVLTLDPSPSWMAWTRINGQLLGQSAFAEHIEDHITDVQVPDPATMLEVVQTLVGSTDVEWKSGKRLSDGTAQISYVETAQARAGQKGDLDIPESFVLALAPFRGEDKVDVHGRLRWRLNGGDVKFGIRLDRPEDVVDAAIEKVRDRLATDGGEARVYVGSAS